jgi:hypothetical protein
MSHDIEIPADKIPTLRIPVRQGNFFERAIKVESTDVNGDFQPVPLTDANIIVEGRAKPNLTVPAIFRKEVGDGIEISEANSSVFIFRIDAETFRYRAHTIYADVYLVLPDMPSGRHILRIEIPILTATSKP